MIKGILLVFGLGIKLLKKIDVQEKGKKRKEKGFLGLQKIEKRGILEL